MPNPRELLNTINIIVGRQASRVDLKSGRVLGDPIRDGFKKQEKIVEGFTKAVIIYPPFVPLFLSDDPEMVKARDEFIIKYGGAENIEFHKTRAGEIVVLFKVLN